MNELYRRLFAAHAASFPLNWTMPALPPGSPSPRRQNEWAAFPPTSNGPIVGLVNNAGAYEARQSSELSLTEFGACMRLNASAVLVACRAYPGLKQSGDGLIVNIGSFFDKLG
jgi:NAD(P)-dependent dehydrogenase (short-subunit alcohol dehydrogenase family)